MSNKNKYTLDQPYVCYRFVGNSSRKITLTVIYQEYVVYRVSGTFLLLGRISLAHILDVVNNDLSHGGQLTQY